jgi:hypothetical protein
VSNIIFPSNLPGMDIKIRRAVSYNVHGPLSLTRKRYPFTYETYPLTRFEVSFNVLRSDSSISSRSRELQRLFSLLGRAFGSLDSFLLTDPDDQSVTDHGFAVGDGATTGFQLQRTLGGDIIDAAGVTYRAQTKPYLNGFKNSSFETDTNADGLADSWNVFNNASGTEPHVARIVPGMNGGKAQRISWGVNSTQTKGLNQTGVSKVAGQWYTISFFARAFGGAVGGPIGFAWNNAPSTTTVIASPTLTGAWQRYVIQVFWNVGATVDPDFFTGYQGASFGDVEFDLFQITAGQWTAADLQPVETPAATVATDTPALWPAITDGFEPIFDLNGDITVYQDGDWQGRRKLYPYARTNQVQLSEQVGVAPWSNTASTMSANGATAPDGTVTADLFGEGTVPTTAHFVNQGITVATGELRCYSIFVKPVNLPNINFGRDIGGFIKFNLSTGAIDGTGGVTPILASGVITSPLWPGWYRIWFVVRENTAQSSNGQMYVYGTAAGGTYNATYTGTSRSFNMWGAQAEVVFDLNGPTPYIKTPATAAVTVTDYTLNSSGLVTLATALPAAAYLSWDGSFYRRVRFETDEYAADRIVTSLWESKTWSLISVKP